jgi:two-component system OmpR family sensor kinase
MVSVEQEDNVPTPATCRLREIADAAEALAADGPSERENRRTGEDDLARLGDALERIKGALHEARLRAATAEESQRRFVTDASHEIRIPLTVIRGEAELLLRRDTGDDPDRCAALAAIEEEAARLGRLMDDLLTLNYSKSGLRLRPQAVDLRTFLRGFIERYAEAWLERALRLQIEDDISLTVEVDQDSMTRILLNVVDNAARYSAAGTPITITVGRDAERVVIAVSDEGPGMSAEEAERVFDRFYRGSTGREQRGMGLGLSIVRALAEAGGATVTLDTAPDRGTTVSISLPATTT